MALQSLAGRQGEPPAVLTCSALQRVGIDAVWEAVARRTRRLAANAELAARRRRQNLRWLWVLVEEQLRLAVQSHPSVRAIRDELERQVLAGTVPATGAARRIIAAFTTPAGE
jgi:LAO/AO transport system kinase